MPSIMAAYFGHLQRLDLTSMNMLHAREDDFALIKRDCFGIDLHDFDLSSKDTCRLGKWLRLDLMLSITRTLFRIAI